MSATDEDPELSVCSHSSSNFSESIISTVPSDIPKKYFLKSGEIINFISFPLLLKIYGKEFSFYKS
jgi:hypothetical protein